jgi:glycerate dehydrogenase
MKKLVVTNPMGFSPDQKARLEKLGDVTYHDTHPTDADEWLERCQGFDIICSWINGLRDHYDKLKDVFISVPFVGVSSFADPKVVKTQNLIISNSPGSNRHAVSEWIIYMILTSMRRLDHYLNTTENLTIPLPIPSIGLAGKHITILGKGNIGTRVGAICTALEMHVTYFTRGDDLHQSIKTADVIVDALSTHPTSKGLLNQAFFAATKKDAIFISVTVDAITDFDAMLAALDRGQLAYVAHDVMNAKPGDTKNPLYQRLLKHKKVFTTPHISAFTDVTNQIGNDMMIANVESFIAGNPINVFN